MQIIKEYPAVKYVAVPAGYMFEEGESFAVISNNGATFKEYKLGSVVGYAKQYGDDIEKSVAQAESRGDDMHFAFPVASMLTAHKQAQRTVPAVFMSQQILFDGKVFDLEVRPNNNIGLKESRPSN